MIFPFFSLGSDFFWNGLPNPFIVHYRSIILFDTNFFFSLMVFCSHEAILCLFSCFLFSFSCIFLEMVFPINS